MNNKLFCILGKQGSGKSSILNELLKIVKEEDNIHLLKSRTTRPRRESEAVATEYIFTTKEQFSEDYKNGNVLEYAVYSTVGGVWYYYTHKDDCNLSSHSYVKIINPIGFCQLSDNISDENIVSIEIVSDDSTRLKRTILRGDSLNEVLRRLEADDKDFKHLKTLYRIKNNDGDNVRDLAKVIYDIIKGEL